MGTRDIYIALIMTAVFFVLSNHIFNEESHVCILPEKFRQFHLLVDTDGDGEISQKEIDEAINLLTKAREQESTKQKEKVYHYFLKTKNH